MKLVVAVDGEACARSALAHIENEKFPNTTEVHLVHVLVPGFAETHVEGIPDVVEEERNEEEGVLARLKQELKDSLGIDASSEILSGETADTIANVCKQVNADQVIVPSHARHGFSRLWFGSVADEIVDAAPCAVLVLKMPQGTK